MSKETISDLINETMKEMGRDWATCALTELEEAAKRRRHLTERTILFEGVMAALAERYWFEDPEPDLIVDSKVSPDQR